MGGWTLSSTTLANGTDIVLDSSNKKVTINDTTFGNAGIQLDYNGGSPQFYVGDGSNEYIKYITGSGVSISTAHENAITIESGGNISLEAGGDIQLTPSDTNPAIIEFGTAYNIGAADTVTRGLCIWPSSAGAGYLNLGYSPTTGTAQPFYGVNIRSKYDTSLQAYYDANNYAELLIAASSTRDSVTIELNDGGRTTEYTFRDREFLPVPSAAVNLGGTTNLFNQGWFNDYVIALGGVHVGGTSDPGTDNLLVDGNFSLSGNVVTNLIFSGNTYPIVYAGDTNVIFKSYNTSPEPDETQFWIAHSGSNVDIKNERGEIHFLCCITDTTCEIFTEDALSIINDITHKGSGKFDKFGHEKYDMKRLYKKYPYLFSKQEVDERENPQYTERLGAKSDLLYRAAMQLKEENESLKSRIAQLEELVCKDRSAIG